MRPTRGKTSGVEYRSTAEWLDAQGIIENQVTPTQRRKGEEQDELLEFSPRDVARDWSPKIEKGVSSQEIKQMGTKPRRSTKGKYLTTAELLDAELKDEYERIAGSKVQRRRSIQDELKDFSPRDAAPDLVVPDSKEAELLPDTSKSKDLAAASQYRTTAELMDEKYKEVYNEVAGKKSKRRDLTELKDFSARDVAQDFIPSQEKPEWERKEENLLARAKKYRTTAELMDDLLGEKYEAAARVEIKRYREILRDDEGTFARIEKEMKEIYDKDEYIITADKKKKLRSYFDELEQKSLKYMDEEGTFKRIDAQMKEEWEKDDSVLLPTKKPVRKRQKLEDEGGTFRRIEQEMQAEKKESDPDLLQEKAPPVKRRKKSESYEPTFKKFDTKPIHAREKKKRKKIESTGPTFAKVDKEHEEILEEVAGKKLPKRKILLQDTARDEAKDFLPYQTKRPRSKPKLSDSARNVAKDHIPDELKRKRRIQKFDDSARDAAKDFIPEERARKKEYELSDSAREAAKDFIPEELARKKEYELSDSAREAAKDFIPEHYARKRELELDDSARDAAPDLVVPETIPTQIKRKIQLDTSLNIIDKEKVKSWVKKGSSSEIDVEAGEMVITKVDRDGRIQESFTIGSQRKKIDVTKVSQALRLAEEEEKQKKSDEKTKTKTKPDDSELELFMFLTILDKLIFAPDLSYDEKKKLAKRKR
ncbi:MAG: hypothetical protein ACTSRW_09100 [Candidatus Helarchaeota archaeon]